MEFPFIKDEKPLNSIDRRCMTCLEAQTIVCPKSSGAQLCHSAQANCAKFLDLQQEHVFFCFLQIYFPYLSGSHRTSILPRNLFTRAFVLSIPDDFSFSFSPQSKEKPLYKNNTNQMRQIWPFLIKIKHRIKEDGFKQRGQNRIKIKVYRIPP